MISALMAILTAAAVTVGAQWAEVQPTEPIMDRPYDGRYDVQEPEPQEYEPVDENAYYGPSEGLTAWGGVYWYNGRKETWYSSRVLYHYLTPTWWCDGDGFWRTAEGYYVVASVDYPYGSLVDMSKGTAQVLDSGCASGTLDIYTNW